MNETPPDTKPAKVKPVTRPMRRVADRCKPKDDSKSRLDSGRKTPERDTQIKVVNWFKEVHPTWVVFSVPNEATFIDFAYFSPMGILPGVPDLVCLTTFGVVLIELKADGGCLTMKQTALHAKIRALNIPVFVCHSLSQVKAVFVKLAAKT